jgi:hypothetical protein
MLPVKGGVKIQWGPNATPPGVELLALLGGVIDPFSLSHISSSYLHAIPTIEPSLMFRSFVFQSDGRVKCGSGKLFRL